MENKFSPDTVPADTDDGYIEEYPHLYNKRACPSCGEFTIYGMPGGRDASCTYCGYKDPCCSD